MSGCKLPPWSRDEIVLALALAVARQGYRISVDDPEIVDLSALLRSVTPSDDVRFRNPHGVARKVWTFATVLAGHGQQLTSAIERSVWDEFVRNPAWFELQERQARARLMLKAQMPSRGPRPSVGTFAVERADQPSVVYAAILDGIRLVSGELLLKVGRTNAIDRRERELNFGLPRVLSVQWRMVRSWGFATSSAAHQAEQAILHSEARRGRSAGGEFIRLDQSGLDQFLQRCEATIPADCEPRGSSGYRRRRPHRTGLQRRRRVKVQR